jgi:hypothetical protein
VSGIEEFRALVKQRTWDKEVLLWRGPEKSMAETLTTIKHLTLDLVDLFDVNNLPIDDDETRDELRTQLRQRLRSIPKGPDNRTVLIVKSIGLLARYNVGLKEFYDWFIGSHTLVVLLLESVVEPSKWPDDVRCEAKRLIDYFAAPTMVKAVYNSQG